MWRSLIFIIRHSGAMRSIEPEISRFQVRLCEAPRNDAMASILRDAHKSALLRMRVWQTLVVRSAAGTQVHADCVDKCRASRTMRPPNEPISACLLYTSDA